MINVYCVIATGSVNQIKSQNKGTDCIHLYVLKLQVAIGCHSV